MVGTRQFLAVKLSQHSFLDATALTMLLAIMIVGYLVPSGSELDNLTGLAHHDEHNPVLLGCLGLFFLAEFILCAKRVMAVNGAGNANSWGHASMISTSQPPCSDGFACRGSLNSSPANHTVATIAVVGARCQNWPSKLCSLFCPMTHLIPDLYGNGGCTRIPTLGQLPATMV